MSRSYLSAFALLVGLLPAVLAEEKLITKVYSVADLVVPIEGLPGVKAETPACCEMIGVASGCMKAKKTEHEALINLVTSTVKPSSWGDHGGPATIEYFPHGMGLVVRQTAGGHQEIADLLTSLRNLQETQIVFEVRLLSMSPESGIEYLPSDGAHLGTNCRPAPIDGFERIGVDFECRPDKPIFFNHMQMQLFISSIKGDPRTSIMQSPKLTTFNGQTATVQCGDTQRFVTGMTPIERDGQTLFMPKSEMCFLGTTLELQGVVAADRKSITVRVKGDYSNLVGKPELYPITSFVTPIFEGGSQGQPIPFTQFIQKPKIEKLSVARTASVAQGMTMLIPMGKMTSEVRTESGVPVLSEIPYVNRLFKTVGYGKETNCMVLLVTPTVIEQSDIKTVKTTDGCGLRATQAACKNAGIFASTYSVATAWDTPSVSGLTFPKGQYIELPPQYLPEEPESPLPRDLGYSEEWAPMVRASATVPATKPTPRSDSMNLADVVALSTSGVSDDVIINQMDTSGAKFTLCTEDILFLKKNKVSDRVVMEMQNTRPRKGTEMSPPANYYPSAPVAPVPPTTYYPAPAVSAQPQCVPVAPPVVPVPPTTYYQLPSVPAQPPCVPAAPPAVPVPPTTYYPAPAVPAPPTCLPTPQPTTSQWAPPQPANYYRLPALPANHAQPPMMPQSQAPQVCPASYSSPCPVPISPQSSQGPTNAIEFFAEAIGELADGIVEIFSGEGNQSRYDSDPNLRMRQLLNDSEDLRPIREVNSRPWMTNQPANWPYERLSGSIGP